MNTQKLELIISIIDKYLEYDYKKDVLTAVEAAELLDKAGVLKDSLSRPGKPLRDILRAGYITHAYQLSNGRWFIPHSDGKYEKSIQKPVGVATSQISEEQLMNSSNFLSVKQLNDLDIPDSSGVYVVKIKNIDKLPPTFGKVLKERKHKILYIGISTNSLRKRLWGNELHAKGHGTFFRSLGAILGYLPETGSLLGYRNKRNYKFSTQDSARIIRWIEDNLEINFIVHSENLEKIEESLIVKYVPLLNLDKNPVRLSELVESRRKCEAVANGY